jgi:formylglycine-generating enzyme required for sulfatase activity
MRPSLRAPWLALSLIGAAPALAAEWPALDRPPVAEGGGSKDAAVVVGIGDYAYLSDIPGARANATAWYQWLKQTREVPVVRALFDEQGTRAGILEAAEQMAKRVQPGGTLWFVFVGHGAPSQAGDDGVLVGAAAQQRVLDFYPNTVRRQELLDLLEGGQQERLVVVLDACFSGRGGQGEALVKDLQPALLSGSWSPSRATVLTAGRSDQFAGPLPGGARPSFSYLLLGALRGWGDLDRDGQVTVAEAHSWVSDAMLELVTDRSQTPELQGADQDLVLSRGREPAPDLSAFVVGEGGGRPGELADQLAQLARAQQQREAAEAAAAEAAQKARELLARLEAERNEKLDSAEDQVLREAASMWARMAPIVASGGPEAKQAVELYVEEYGSRKVWVEDQTGRYERAVRSPELAKAQAWLGTYRGDTGDSGGGAAGAASAGTAGIEWVRIPGGSFRMGSGDGDSDERPVHTVSVAGFEMSRSEVTFGQYQACVRAGVCSAPHVADQSCYQWAGGRWKKGALSSRFQGSEQPVVCVDRDQATTFAGWVGGRLPSEAEWEYAARGGQEHRFAGSNAPDEVAWHERISGERSHDVCGKRPNGYGLCDLSGNVWEWVEDAYHASYAGAPTDGSAWSTSAGSDPVLRGGSWSSAADYARVTNRWNTAGDRSSYIGFRVAR